MREGFSLSRARKQLFREKAAMDYRSGMGAARDEGWAKGYDQARLEYETRAKQDKLEIARKMKAKGWPLPEIAEDTGLPVDAIEKL
jgi:predicted transposase/invertase (TIGR01784 family)